MATTTDAFVWGATPQGIFAAIVLARAGKTVIIATDAPQVGGMLTGGLGITDAVATRNWWGPVKEFTDILSSRTGYTNDRLRWCFAPSDAVVAFNQLLSVEPNITIKLSEQLVGVERNQAIRVLGQLEGKIAGRGAKIRSVTTTGDTYTANVFIDASYGADLLANAGVPHRLGREGVTYRNEVRAGVHREYQTDKAIHSVDADGDLHKYSQYAPHQPTGAADRKTMGTGFRHCVTNVAGNMLPWAPPPGYNPADFAADIALAQQLTPTYLHQDLGWFLRRTSYDAARAEAFIPGWAGMTQTQRETAWLTFTDASAIALAPDKFATNGSDIIGPLAWEYTLANGQRREQIRQHLAYREAGRWYTFATHPDVPVATRASYAQIGFCADEWSSVYSAVQGFPPEIYHREGRRLIGRDTVDYWHAMYQVNWPEQIAFGGYFADSKAKTQFAKPAGGSLREGAYGPGHFVTEDGAEVDFEGSVYFGIPMGAVVPPEGECDNLAVCWGISATAMGFAAIRLEPFLNAVATGVGHMAVESLVSGTPIARLSYGAVRARLDAAGALLYRYQPT